MENLKIKVNNEAESKEAQELFFELGGKPHSDLMDRCGLVVFANGVIYVDSDSFEKYYTETYKAKEITLPQLRDMVVLKRRKSVSDRVAVAGEAKQESKSISDTLAERQSTYGCFEDVAFVTEGIMGVLSKVRPNGLNDLPQTHRMALYMIASKMARIVNGDFNHKDSWHDIGGYAKLIDDLIGE